MKRKGIGHLNTQTFIFLKITFYLVKRNIPFQEIWSVLLFINRAYSFLWNSTMLSEIHKSPRRCLKISPSVHYDHVYSLPSYLCVLKLPYLG